MSEVVEISQLVDDHTLWLSLIKTFITQSPKLKIEDEMCTLSDRYHSDDNFRSVVNDYCINLRKQGINSNVLFAWKAFKVVHDKVTRAMINTKVTDKIKERKDAESKHESNLARSLLEAVNKGRMKYRNEMRSIQDYKLKIIRDYKDTLAKIKAIEDKCYKQNEVAIKFYSMMEDHRRSLAGEAEDKWCVLEENIKKVDYFNDFDAFKNDEIDKGMIKWILSHKDDDYVVYCKSAHISGINSEETEDLEEEIQEMINNNNLDFLNHESIEEVINRLKKL